ncbi:MAG: hypothetical protein WKG06_32235 [Segetibacter sp.]
MKQYSFFAKIVFALAFTALVIGFSAFSQKQQKSSIDSFRKEQFSKDNDTSTSRKRNRDRADWNFDKLDEQMKQVDVEKINKQLKESLKNIDWEKINNQVVESVNVSKFKMAEVKKEMEQVKANLEKQKIDIKSNAAKIEADIEKAMKNAKRSIENAKEELKNLREFTDVLEKDGLIDKSKKYKIEVKNDELYIDGKKQSKEISDKYRQYYHKSNFTIDMNEGDDDDIRI